MKKAELDQTQCTVTANYQIKLLRTTPFDAELVLKAKVVSAENDRAKVVGELYAEDKLCATCEGLFVAVQPGHPAYHRW
jgi:acyl-coenzyme A thioesterase PaaI-like protein